MAAKSTSTTPAQGRLLDPSMTLATDPRLHPSIRQYFLQLAPVFTTNSAPPPDKFANGTASLEELASSIKQEHEGFRAFTDHYVQSVPIPEPSVKVTHEKKEIPGPDGNTIDLHIYRPEGSGVLPSVVYIHGGAMVFLDLSFKILQSWMKYLSALGNLVVIGVEFRNGWSEKGFNPFPAGLNDCATAVQWIHAHKAELNISKLVLQGESGGGNLSIATALKANQEGWINKIDGVYAEAPYISGAYHWTYEEQIKAGLESLVECDGYGFNVKNTAIKAAIYESGGYEHTQATNPLAWPWHATEKVLTGLPPFVISTDEIDPLRDEGMAFYRKLVAAGVRARGTVKLGLPHAGAQCYGGVVLDDFYALIVDIKSFVYSL